MSSAVGVHAEGAHHVLKLLGAVDDLALVELVGQVGEDLRRKLHAHADVDAVGHGGDAEGIADLLHPLAAAAPDGHHAPAAGEAAFGGHGLKAALDLLEIGDGGLEVKVHPVLELVVDVLQHHIVDVRAEVPYLGVKQVQTVFQAHALDFGVGGGIELCPLAAVAEVDLIHVLHQFYGLGLADMLIKRAAELVRDVVLAVGKRARAAEAAHDAAGLAADAGLDLLAVDGAVPLVQGLAQLQNADLQAALCPCQLVCGKDAAGARAHDNDIVIHDEFSLLSKKEPSFSRKKGK